MNLQPHWVESAGANFIIAGFVLLIIFIAIGLHRRHTRIWRRSVLGILITGLSLFGIGIILLVMSLLYAYQNP